jgi:hypothetical protein
MALKRQRLNLYFVLLRVKWGNAITAAFRKQEMLETLDLCMPVATNDVNRDAWGDEALVTTAVVSWKFFSFLRFSTKKTTPVISW